MKLLCSKHRVEDKSRPSVCCESDVFFLNQLCFLLLVPPRPWTLLREGVHSLLTLGH